MLTIFDIVVILVVFVFAIRGGMRGFFAEVAGLLGLLAGLLLARTFLDKTTEFFSRLIAEKAASVVAFIALFLAGILVVGLCARILQRAFELAFAGWLDKLMGLVVGIIKGSVVCAFLAYIALLAIPQFDEIKNSVTIPYFMDVIQRCAEYMNISIPVPAFPQQLSMMIE